MQYAKSNAYADEFDVDCMVWSLRLWGSSLQAVLGVARDKHNSRPQKHSAHIVSCGQCHDASWTCSPCFLCTEKIPRKAHLQRHKFVSCHAYCWTLRLHTEVVWNFCLTQNQFFMQVQINMFPQWQFACDNDLPWCQQSPHDVSNGWCQCTAPGQRHPC